MKSNLFKTWGMGDPTICVYQFIYNEKDIVDIKKIHYFIVNRLVLFVKIHSYVAHMFYAWSFSHKIVVPIAIMKNK